MPPKPIPLARPNITQTEIDAVLDVLRSDRLALGPKMEAFEQAFALYCGTTSAVACSSGTAGLHMLIRALGIREGDEVITTPFSFVASANCVLYERARPMFVDIDPLTWNLDPAGVETAISPRTRAILAVDVFGVPADMNAIQRIAAEHDLPVIEDACEALGARYDGRPAGSFGSAATFGFYPNKQITTGEGGMITTSDDALATRLRSLRNQGRDPGGGWLAHARLGYNYRLSEMNCALGLAQLSRVEEILSERERVARIYRERLTGEARLSIQQVPTSVQKSWFVFVVRLSDAYTREDRDRILSRLTQRGIGCSNYFVPIHLQPVFRERFGHEPGDFPICEALSQRTIALPFHHSLSEADIDRICTELTSLL